VWRFGDVTTAWTMNGLRAVSVGVAGFAGIGGLAAAISGVIGWRLARRIESGSPQVHAPPQPA
jgi:AAA family ATP:ADP antiporter